MYASFTSNKLNNVHCTELNDAPETMSSWMLMLQILEKNPLMSTWLPVASNQLKLLILIKIQVSRIPLMRRDFSQQLPMLIGGLTPTKKCATVDQVVGICPVSSWLVIWIPALSISFIKVSCLTTLFPLCLVFVVRVGGGADRMTHPQVQL